MKLHHATAKRAEENGVTMEHDGESWVATKGDVRWADEHAPVALDAAIFGARINAEYPALALERTNDGFRVTANEEHLWPLDNDGKAVFASVPPKPADLAEIVDYAVELGIDPSEGFEEDDEQEGGSVVAPHYKAQYAADGHPNNNGDWFAQTMDSLKLVVAVGKRTVADVQALNTLFADNGIISEDHKFGAAFHGTAPRTNGWEGRFRMGGGNMMRRKVADAGFMMAFGEKIEAPADFCERYRTKSKKKAKKAEASDEAGA